MNNGSFFLSHRAHLAIAATKEGFDVAVACPNGPAVADIKRLGLRHMDYPVPRGVGGLFAELKAALKLYNILSKSEPDLVHLVTAKPVIVGGIIARFLRTPVVAAITGLGHVYVDLGAKSRFLRALANLGYRLALRSRRTVAIFQNQENLDLFRRLKLVGSRHQLIKGAGVNLDQFDPSAIPHPGDPIVLLPARMLKTKGVLDFVSAARLLRQRGVPAKFVLAGAPDIGNPATVTIEELNAFTAEGVAEWIGHQDDISDAMARSTVVALPSFYNEGLPKSLIDAAASARPIVTTDIAGCRDAIINGETGLLVRPRDPVDLADKIAELLADRERSAAMGKAGRRLAETEFSDTIVFRRHLSIYKELLRSADAPGGSAEASF